MTFGHTSTDKVSVLKYFSAFMFALHTRHTQKGRNMFMASSYRFIAVGYYLIRISLFYVIPEPFISFSCGFSHVQDAFYSLLQKT